MNILAIDYGTKRIGLAWVQLGLGVVLPYGIIEKPTLQGQVQAVVELIEKEGIDTLVVGLPLGLNGKENENTERVHAFVLALKKAKEISVEFIDERFSSKQADVMGGDASRDEKAAMVLLQNYLAN